MSSVCVCKYGRDLCVSVSTDEFSLVFSCVCVCVGMYMYMYLHIYMHE